MTRQCVSWIQAPSMAYLCTAEASTVASLPDNSPSTADDLLMSRPAVWRFRTQSSSPSMSSSGCRNQLISTVVILISALVLGRARQRSVSWTVIVEDVVCRLLEGKILCSGMSGYCRRLRDGRSRSGCGLHRLLCLCRHVVVRKWSLEAVTEVMLGR